MQLSVVIVSFNVCDFLEQCLYSLRLAAASLNVEIIVVDNASEDDTAAVLPALFPEVRFIWNKTNAGFSKACNIGAAVASGEYLLLLNPDTLLPENALSTALSFLKQTPGIGAVGMRMYDGRIRFLPESKRGYPSLSTAFYKLSGLIRLFPNHPKIARYYLGHLSPEMPHRVDILAGAFFMVSLALYKELGGLDENYFMYGEDIDLSHTITRAGYQNYYLPNPGIIHFKGESTLRNAQNARHFYHAMHIFRTKQGKPPGWLELALTELAIRIRTWRNREVHTTPVVKFQYCSSLETYNRTQPTIFVLSEVLSMSSLLGELKTNPPKAPVLFHFKGSRTAVGSQHPAQRGQVYAIPENERVY